MMATPGHKGFSVSEDEAITCIPDSLYMFLRLICGGQEVLENDSFNEREDVIKRRVLSIAQDLVYCTSGGGKWTPKHIGLANTLHQATRSKDLVQLLHKAGHCLSYEQMLQVDTALAENSLHSLDQDTGANVPANIVPNEFVHFTADNIDILDETLDGKNTFHATQRAAWQRGQNSNVHLDMLKPSKRHDLKIPDVLQNVEPATINNPRRNVPIFTAPNQNKVLFPNQESDSECVKQAKATDMAFFLQRQDYGKGSWTVFNQSLSSDEPEQTAAGYLPMILAPAHEYDTLNTVVRRCMSISAQCGQEHTVITVDQALYCKLMELKWSVEEYKEKLIPRLGGLHTAMNFLKVIGDHMAGSGLAEVWIESGLLGEGAAHLVLSGKAYTKAMRAHKLTLQALWRILMPSFLAFLDEKDNELHSKLVEMINDTPERITELISCLKQDCSSKVLNQFIKSKSDDVNFTFWWNYMDMVSILLHFTRAQRDGIWNLHLESFSMMIPYFMRYNHYNYARWGPVYLAEMQQLPESVLREFHKGNFVVKRSTTKFSQVDPDQAMEWINGTGKKVGGIVGITKTTSALSRWALTYNLRMQITDETYAMFHHSINCTQSHKEMTVARQSRDHRDETALVDSFNQFKMFQSTSPELLQNLVTKDLATEEIKMSLLHAKVLGQEKVATFTEERMIVPDQSDKPKLSLYEPLKKNQTKTFASLFEVVKNDKEKDKQTILKLDRNVLQRLITAYEVGRPVDLQ